MTEKIYNEQRELVDKFIKFYEPDFMGADEYLKIAYDKAPVIKDLLGEEMYREIPNVVINADSDSLEYKMGQLLDNNDFVSEYTSRVQDVLVNYDAATAKQIRNILLSLIEEESLIRNASELKDDIYINGTEVQIKEGMKIMRALRKVSEALEINMELFEKFRREHAKILSTKTLKGTLCLSALPMDYLTLSDNASNWTSCYSWRREAIYHPSTLAYLNAPNTIVVYLKNDKENYSWEEGEWNNKMWRQLIYIDYDFIIPGRGYPYDSAQLTELCVNWIKELMPNGSRFMKSYAVCINSTLYCKALGISIGASIQYAYDDFYGHNNIWLINKTYPISHHEILFDGIPHCLICGKELEVGKITSNANAIDMRVCTDCRKPIICEYCGSIVFSNGIETDEGIYHPECFIEKESLEDL